jgi:hypothetical protein
MSLAQPDSCKPDENENSIFHRSKACANLLNECLNTPALAANGWAANQTASFKLWVESIGAFARRPASADTRLRDSADMKNAVTGLLTLLQLSLEQSKQILNFFTSASSPINALF